MCRHAGRRARATRGLDLAVVLTPAARAAATERGVRSLQASPPTPTPQPMSRLLQAPPAGVGLRLVPAAPAIALVTFRARGRGPRAQRGGVGGAPVPGGARARPGTEAPGGTGGAPLQEKIPARRSQKFESEARAAGRAAPDGCRRQTGRLAVSRPG